MDCIKQPPIAETSHLCAGLSLFPTTSGQHTLVLKSNNLFSLLDDEFEEVFNFVRNYASLMKEFHKVQRCGLAYDGHQRIHIIPMHGLSDEWKAILTDKTPAKSTYPGFLWTKDSQQIETETLDKTQDLLTASSGWTIPDHTFHGDNTDDNLFAKLIRGEIPQWRFWEDNEHVAFLTPFGNSPGYSVLIPRSHLSSDILGLLKEDLFGLVRAARKVANVLMSGMNTTRVGMFMEGFEIDYAHIKLVPVLDDRADIEGPSDEYQEIYAGYLTTRLGPKGNEAMLNSLQKDFLEFYNTGMAPSN